MPSGKPQQDPFQKVKQRKPTNFKPSHLVAETQHDPKRSEMVQGLLKKRLLAAPNWAVRKLPITQPGRNTHGSQVQKEFLRRPQTQKEVSAVKKMPRDDLGICLAVATVRSIQTVTDEKIPRREGPTVW